MSGTLECIGILQGHSDRVTSLTAPTTGEFDIVASTSRDKSAIIWKVGPQYQDLANGIAGTAAKRCVKHNQYLTDAHMSPGGDFLLTASGDKTMRLWDIGKGETALNFRNFTGHTGAVNSCVISPDSRQILSASADGSIRLWNTLGQQKYKFSGDNIDRIQCIKLSPIADKSHILSCSWDGSVKSWNLKDGKVTAEYKGHRGPVDTLCISPDGSLCASGGRDGTALLWDLDGSHLYSLEAGSAIHSLCFSPCKYWLCAATDGGIKIWDLEKKKLCADVQQVASCRTGVEKASDNSADIVDYKRATQNKEVIPMAHFDNRRQRPSRHLPWVTSLTWNASGNTLYAGSHTGEIYVFGLKQGL